MATSGLVIWAILVINTVTGDTRHGYGSCSNCGGGGSGAYNSGRNIGAAINGVISNKIQGVAGFIDGLVGGPAHGGGCGGCSSSCGSPGCGSGYVSQPNPCSSNSCYSSQTPVSSPVSCRAGSCGGSVSSPVSCRTGACSSSSHSHGSSSSSSGSTTVIVVQQSPSHSSSQTSHNPSGYPNCQCDYLFNKAGQGNCNESGARSHTSDRWCYIAEDVNGQWVEAQWACPDSVRSDVHTGRFWSRLACDTPKHGHG